MVGTGALAALLATHATGCTKKTPVTPEAVPTTGHSDLLVTLTDGTRVGLENARSRDGSVCGDARRCEGPSCMDFAPKSCIPNEKIAGVTMREVDGTSVALGAGVFALGAAALTVLAVSATSNRSSGSQSSSSGSSGAGGRMGSCPRMYSWDGTRWRLDSGTFGVSYFHAAPRTDYDLLDYVVAERGKYRLRLVNEQDETEHTDLVRLRVVDHPAGTRVVPTASGKLLTMRGEVLPTTALDFRGRDARELVSSKDDREWSSDLSGRRITNADDARDGLRLAFTKPADAKIAKLRVAAHNTDWAGSMLGYLLAHRGTSLPAWWGQMNADAKARGELDAFLIREGMLNVRVKTPSGWETRGMFWAAGSEIVKEEGFEIAVGDIPGESLEVELESALDFWSVDAASVSYGVNEATAVRDLAPSSARTNAGRDVTATLAKADGVRFDTVRGDVAELVFDAPPAPPTGSIRSFVLQTNGYYVPEIPPAADADPAAMDALMDNPFAASRLALAFRLAVRR